MQSRENHPHLRIRPPRRRRSIASFALVLLVVLGFSTLLWQRQHPTVETQQQANKPELVVSEQLQGTKGRPLSKVLVLASFAEQEGLEWLDEVPQEWSIHRYLYAAAGGVDSAGSSSGDMSRKVTTVALPINQGREALAYLTFLTTHYDALPEVMFFTHGADRSWHSPARTIHRLRALNLSALLSDDTDESGRHKGSGYVALRCAISPTCASASAGLDLSRGPAHMGSMLSPVRLLPAFWAHVFPEGNLPSRVAAPWGGEFAVSRHAVQKRPKAFWERLKRLVEGNLKTMDRQLKEWSVNRWAGARRGSEGRDMFGGQALNANNGYVVGALFEHMWHYLYGQDATHCPTQLFCEKTLFSAVIDCESAGIKPDVFGGFPGWEDKRCQIDERALAQIEKDNIAVRWYEHGRPWIDGDVKA